MSPIEPDLNVLSVAEAAKVLRCSEWAVRQRLREDEDFAKYVLIPLGGRQRISRVRLERWIHGERVA